MGIVLLLVICSALIHTYWNFVLKRAINRGADSVLLYWLSGVFGVVVYSAAFFRVFGIYGMSLSGLVLAAFCGLFLAVYAFFLSRAYSYADLSYVYPLAKITPLFTLLLGVFYLGESVSRLALLGIFVIVLGIYSMNLKSFGDFLGPILSLSGFGALFALFAALASSGYGLFSKIGVGSSNPFVFVYSAFFFSSVFYAPLLFFRSSNILDQFFDFKLEILQIAVLDLFGYSLILIALSFGSLSYVFALRQLSIVFSVLAGIFFFREKQGFVRIVSSLFILAGVVLISVG